MTTPFGLPYVYPSTIVPQNWDLFIPYFNRLYEQMAQTINNKDNNFYTMGITSTAQNILQVPLFGAFLICVSGQNSTLPTIVATLNKADSAAPGSAIQLDFQPGTGAWAGNILIITSTATNFQIRHDRTGVTGTFNIRLIGTQL